MDSSSMNQMCSPELSFSSADNVPYAYVAYITGEKEVVPTHFIFKFPSTWRNGWDANYLYKVFWSPDDSDSPQKVLQRSPEIPMFEPGQAANQAGYYRASVLLIAESQDELQKLMDAKRITLPLGKRYTSFDGTIQNSESKKIPIPSKKVKGEVKKSKGINKAAVVENTSEELRSLLKKKVGGSSSESGPSGVKVSKEVSKTSLSKSSDKKAKDHEDGPPALKRNLREKKVTIKKENLISSESSESDVEISGKKIKLDPDLTPKKYEEQKAEISIKNTTILKLKSFNERLQEKIMDLENQNMILKKELEEANMAKINSESVPVPPTNRNVSKASKSTRDDEISAVQDSEYNDLDPSFLCETSIASSSDGLRQETSPVKETNKLSSEKDENKVESMLPQDVSRNADLGSTLQNNKGKPEVSSTKSSSPISVKALLPDVHVEDESVWDVIHAIKSGDKKDLRFVKNLAIVGFGPEVLAGHSIKGTKRGRCVEHRPPLDGKVLDQIFDCLVKRVEQEDGEKDENPRLSKKRFHDTIRQAQKKVRELGYGKGTKSNDTTKDLLME